MARIRYLKPEFWEDREIAKLSFEERLCFQGLWNFADKEGRLRDDPEWLKVKIFPYDKVDIDKCLIRLSQKKTTGKPFIYRYETDGQRYIQILEWHKHQKPHKYEQDSKIPRCSNVEPTSKDVASTTSIISQVKGNGELKGQREVIPLDCKADLYKTLKDLPIKETDGLLTFFCQGLSERGRCYDPKKCVEALREIVEKTKSIKPDNYYGYLKASIENLHKGKGYKSK
jgi:hypothetical protein